MLKSIAVSLGLYTNGYFSHSLRSGRCTDLVSRKATALSGGDVGRLVFGRNLTSKLDLTDLAKLLQKPPCRLGLDLHFNERSVYSSLSPHIFCSFRVGGQSEHQRLAWGRT